MNTSLDAIYARIEEEENELNRLNDIKRQLRAEERNIPRQAYQREWESINKHIASTQAKIENDRNIVTSYNIAYSLLNNLDEIFRQYNSVRDWQDREEITKEINAKQKELDERRSVLPDDLNTELSARYIAERSNANNSEMQNSTSENDEQNENIDENSTQTEAEGQMTGSTPTETETGNTNPTETGNADEREATSETGTVDEGSTQAEVEGQMTGSTPAETETGNTNPTETDNADENGNTNPTETGNADEREATTEPPEKQETNKPSTSMIPAMTRAVVPTMTKTADPEKDPNERGLYTIIAELTRGLEVKKDDAKKYRASNIHVAQEFIDELKSGNYIYNIVHLVPALIKIPINIVRKVINKFTTSLEDKKRIETLKTRINNLSDADLKVIWREYRGSRVIGERNPTVLNTLLNERMQRYAMENVTKLNDLMEKKYQKLFETSLIVEDCDSVLNDEKSSDEQKKEAQELKAKTLKGTANIIKGLREDYVQANHWLSGGAHGFEEDMKASATKLSIVGKRFAKDNDLDHELAEKQAGIEQREKRAIISNDDEAALKAFVDNETLLMENTKVQSSIFGERSTGSKYYSPLAEKLDYRNDPFVRDLFTTIAVTAATVSAVSAVDVHGRQADAFQEGNNAANAKLEDEIHGYGETLKGRSNDYMEGMSQQANSDIINNAHTMERSALDQTDWGLGTAAYRKLDSANHEAYNSFADVTKSSLDKIASDCGSGIITNQEALEQVSRVASETRENLLNTYNSYIPIVHDYYVRNPQFDLHGVTEAMEQVALHPDAIVKMNEGMVESVQIGEELLNVNVASINSLPTDLRQTLFGDVAAATALAYNVQKTMDKKVKTGKYGNNVTDMVSDYMASKTEADTASNENVQSEGRTK